MHERGRRASDRDAPLQRRKDDVPQPSAGQEADLGAFPLFADPPFLVWQHRHQKNRQCRQLHPSGMPLILLWDEIDEALPYLDTSNTKRRKGNEKSSRVT